jgi:ABC-type transport system involved in cytochrome c biogenesis permease subunit
MNAAALVLTTIGVGLGGVWAQQRLDRFWGWDAKETGGAMVLLWNATMLVLLGARRLSEHGRLLLGLAGNAVVALAWFGPLLVGSGLHSYGFAPVALPLGAFLLLHGALACLGLVPAGYLRDRRAPRSE